MNKDSQITDKDKAWTAAHSENESRKTLSKSFPGSPEPLSKYLVTREAERIAEKRIRNYNPEEEVKLEALCNKAQGLILRCQTELKKNFGSVEAARNLIQKSGSVSNEDFYGQMLFKSGKVLFLAIENLEASINNIRMDKGQMASEFSNGIMDPKIAISDMEEKINFAVSLISELDKETPKQ